MFRNLSWPGTMSDNSCQLRLPSGFYRYLTIMGYLTYFVKYNDRILKYFTVQVKCGCFCRQRSALIDTGITSCGFCVKHEPTLYVPCVFGRPQASDSGLLSASSQLGSHPETAFAEISGDVRAAHFWPGITSPCRHSGVIDNRPDLMRGHISASSTRAGYAVGHCQQPRERILLDLQNSHGARTN
jgi:hypothetical protein